jgi:hypothetical protein
MGSSVVYQDLTHQPGCYGEEMRTALPVLLLLANHAEIDLVNQRGRLQGVIGAFAAHIPARDFPQFWVDQRDDLRLRGTVPMAQALQKSSDPL